MSILYMKNVQRCKYYTELGNVAVKVQGFTNPRLQVLQLMHIFCGTWVWNFPYIRVLTPCISKCSKMLLKVHGPQQQSVHTILPFRAVSV